LPVEKETRSGKGAPGVCGLGEYARESRQGVYQRKGAARPPVDEQQKSTLLQELARGGKGARRMAAGRGEEVKGLAESAMIPI